jgi:hypothetical protein
MPTALLLEVADAIPLTAVARTVLVRVAKPLTLPSRVAVLRSPSNPATFTSLVVVASPVTVLLLALKRPSAIPVMRLVPPNRPPVRSTLLMPTSMALFPVVASPVVVLLPSTASPTAVPKMFPPLGPAWILARAPFWASSP